MCSAKLEYNFLKHSKLAFQMNSQIVQNNEYMSSIYCCELGTKNSVRHFKQHFLRENFEK